MFMQCSRKTGTSDPCGVGMSCSGVSRLKPLTQLSGLPTFHHSTANNPCDDYFSIEISRFVLIMFEVQLQMDTHDIT